MSDVRPNLRPCDNQTATAVFNEAWAFFKKYRNLSNASSDNSKHFSEEMWRDVCGWTDDEGYLHKGEVDKLYDKYPCEFTYRLIQVLVEELQARDRGRYIGTDEFLDLLKGIDDGK